MNVRLVPLPQIDFCIHRTSLDSVKKMHECAFVFGQCKEKYECIFVFGQCKENARTI